MPTCGGNAAKLALVADGVRLLILDEDGTLALATNAWTPPAVVGKRLYVRDRKNLAAYSFE